MEDLEAFRAEQRPATERSRLAPHRSDIFRLLQEGYSYTQITEYLAKIRVSITKQSLGEWIRRQKANQTALIPQSTSKQAEQKPVALSTPVEEEQKSSPSTNRTSSLSPREIDNMRSSNPDLDKYTRLRRKQK